jgi:hypothetical protein
MSKISFHFNSFEVGDPTFHLFHFTNFSNEVNALGSIFHFTPRSGGHTFGESFDRHEMGLGTRFMFFYFLKVSQDHTIESRQGRDASFGNKWTVCSILEDTVTVTVSSTGRGRLRLEPQSSPHRTDRTPPISPSRDSYCAQLCTRKRKKT